MPGDAYTDWSIILCGQPNRGRPRKWDFLDEDLFSQISRFPATDDCTSNVFESGEEFAVLFGTPCRSYRGLVVKSAGRQNGGSVAARCLAIRAPAAIQDCTFQLPFLAEDV